MTDPEGRSAETLLAQAKQISTAIEDRRHTKPVRGSDACYQACHAVRLALQALCKHFDQNCDDELSLGAMLDLLSSGWVRVPEEVQAARQLDRFAADAAGERFEPTDEATIQAVATAQNVTAWAEVVMSAGKSL